MKDMNGTPIKEGDIVRVNVWGADKKYHPAGKIVKMYDSFIGPKKVQLQWLISDDICSFTHKAAEVVKMEVEDLI